MAELSNITPAIQRQPNEKKLRRWTKEELDFLRKFYPKKGGKFVAEKLNRTHKSVVGQAVRMKLHRDIFKRWEEWEVRYLKKYYGLKPSSSIARTLGRSIDAIQLKAGKLKLVKKPSIPYTKEEKELIKKLYESGEATVKDIAERLGRPESAIRSRINRWGLVSPVRWTKEQWDFLRKNYQKLTAVQIAKHLNRTPRSVIHYANRHGLYKKIGKQR